jgi:phospholipid transport system substrate-binding protein
MNPRSLLTTGLLMLGLLTSGAASAAGAADKETQKPIKALVNAIRYSKDDLASKQVGYDVMVSRLMGDTWAKVSDADKKELIAGMEKLIRGISFPAGRDIFQYLDNVLYDPARVEGEVAKVKSTVVVHRNLKKSEIIIDWVLAKSGGTWKIFDTVMLGESTLESIKKEQIEPLIKEGGVPAVMKAMREKVAEVEAKKKP